MTDQDERLGTDRTEFRRLLLTLEDAVLRTPSSGVLLGCLMRRGASDATDRLDRPGSHS